MLVLGHGGWPLSEAEAVNVVLRYFVGKCAVPVEKRKLMAKLGVTGSKLTVEACQAFAEEHARAALSELVMLGLAEVRTVGPGRAVGSSHDDVWQGSHSPRKRFSYSRTALGREAMPRLMGRVGMALHRAGWP